MENNLFAVILWIVAALCIGIGFGIKKREKPAYLSRKHKTGNGSIKDFTRYNRAVGQLWQIYGIGWGLTGVLVFASSTLGALLAVLTATAGTIILLGCWQRLSTRCKRQ
ncbi:MAG: hypothetical protein ACYCX2_01315 [Christensenellales bacterium]